jgi:hypothetical protein
MILFKTAYLSKISKRSLAYIYIWNRKSYSTV